MCILDIWNYFYALLGNPGDWNLVCTCRHLESKIILKIIPGFIYKVQIPESDGSYVFSQNKSWVCTNSN